MNSNEETIQGVALRTGIGGVYALGSPYRHHDVINWMQETGVGCRVFDAEQGFITSLGRFVSRQQALTIAVNSGQLVIARRRVPELPELYSEDLW